MYRIQSDSIQIRNFSDFKKYFFKSRITTGLRSFRNTNSPYAITCSEISRAKNTTFQFPSEATSRLQKQIFALGSYYSPSEATSLPRKQHSVVGRNFPTSEATFRSPKRLSAFGSNFLPSEATYGSRKPNSGIGSNFLPLEANLRPRK